MCMKNMNATMFISSAISTDGNRATSLIGLYDSVVPIKTQEEYYIDNLNIALNSSIIFDDKFNDDDCIILNCEYECMVRLTHVESGLGVSLNEFELKITENDVRKWCKKFYEFKRFIILPRINLPKGLGSYAVKLLIRKKGDDSWRTQTIHSLIVGGSRLSEEL